MRDIKYRAWDKDEQRMLDWCYLLSIRYGGNKLIDPKVEDSIFNDPDLILMQFIGLYDKNGVEIYEGDILSVTNPMCQIQKARLIGVVEYSWASFYVKIKHTIEWKSYNVDPPEFMLLSSIAGTKEMAVIGNIYEHQELIS